MTEYETVGLRKLLGSLYGRVLQSHRIYGAGLIPVNDKGLIPKDYKPKK